MARLFLGTTLRKWFEYLAAVVLGNAIYFLAFFPYLPEKLRHKRNIPDAGTLIDFLACCAVYGLIRLGAKYGVPSVRRGD